MYDYDSLAAFRIQRQSPMLDCEKEMKRFHKIFYDGNVPVDVIPAGSDLLGYRVVILPVMIIARPDIQKEIRRFAENGGTVIITFRTFVKDEDNNLVFGKKIPLDFQDAAGVCVAETESLQKGRNFRGRRRKDMPVSTGMAVFSGICWRQKAQKCSFIIRMRFTGSMER